MQNLRYKLQEQPDESGATMYQILDTNDMEIIETYDDKTEAQEALPFWNT